MNNQQNSVNLSVKDFQIVKNANLSFLPGLNCIIGQSNNGKSALMRAAKACIYNTPGTTSVRTGCSNFAVGLQMNEHTIILQKGNNSIYKIDNEVYGKIGRTQLDEVAAATMIKELEINGTKETINFWDQMEKPFLLDRSETELFRFIVDSGKDNNITTALKSITQDRQQISKDIVVTEGKIQQIEDTIKKQEEELKDSDKKLEIYNKVVELGPKIKRVQDLTNLKIKAQQDGANLSSELNKQKQFNNILNQVSSKLELIDITNRKMHVLTEIKSRIDNTNNQLKSLLEQLEKTKSLDVSDLNNNFSKYKLLSDLVSKSRSTSDAIQELSNKKFNDISLEFAENAQKYSALNTLIGNINTKKEQISTLENNLSSTIEEIDKINKEINDIGICPTCGQPIHNN